MSPAQIKAREIKLRNHFKTMGNETSYEINNKKKQYVDTLQRIE